MSGAFGLGLVSLAPIGVVRSPFAEKMAAPRQPAAARGVRGTIELARGKGLEDAVLDLAEWSHVWVIFLFHLNTGWRPKVQPPRSRTKRGVLATRSPHRPNPIGLSAVRLDRVDGLTLHVSDLDIVDGSPVLDVKPYVPYADAIATARSGWLASDADGVTSSVDDAPAEDPKPGYQVCWSGRAREQLAFLAEHGVDLERPIQDVLSLGPEPHAYRRIRREPGGLSRLAYKSWRARFRAEGREVVVLSLESGYRRRELESASAEEPDELVIHRAFVARFDEEGT